MNLADWVNGQRCAECEMPEPAHLPACSKSPMRRAVFVDHINPFSSTTPEQRKAAASLWLSLRAKLAGKNPPKVFMHPALFFPKRCGCGRVHEIADWLQLPPASGGLEKVVDDEEGRTRYEYRNCQCGSTLVIAEDLPPEVGS